MGGLNTICVIPEVALPLSSVNTRNNLSVHLGFLKKIENHRALWRAPQARAVVMSERPPNAS